MTNGPSRPDLAVEVEDLRARLAEAEEVLRAIRNGDVDAVLVTGERGEQVYTLRGADRTYRRLIETMSEGAVTVSADGDILYCNVRVAEMLGRPLDRVLGTALRNHLPSADQQALDAILAQARTEPSQREINLKTSEGRLVPVYLSASRLQSEAAEMVFCLVLTDLTEQKRYEHIVEKERLAHLILEQAAEAIVVCDEQGRVIRVSQAAQRFCDGSPLLRPFAEVFPLRPDASGPFHLAPVLQGETLRNVDVALDRQGQNFDLILNAGPLLSGQQILGCVVTLTDITEHKQSEQALRRSRDLLDQTGRLAKIGGWELDLDTQTLIWTAEVYRIHEVDPAIKPTVAEAIQFYAPEARPVITAAVQAAIDTGTPFDLALPLITAQGRHIWVRALGAADRRNGKSIRLYGAFQDITERMRSDESQRLQSAALNAAANAIIITDANGTIEWINAAFTTLTGYGAEEAIGKNPRELVKSGVHDQAFYKHLWETILAGNVWQGEMTNRRKDGSLYLEDLTITPVKDARGEITHFIAIKRDLTEQHELEARFLQAQKMETVGRLAGGIAHDFNNLLTVINGTADLAVTDLREDDPLREDFHEIRRAGERAASLTRQLLAFSRKQIMKFEVLNLGTLVADLQGMLQRLIGEDIALVVALAKDVGSVMADRVQIEQVVLNLAINARDAMPNGGTLTIETRDVALDEAYAAEHPSVQPGPHVMLAISDTGVGMDEATCARIFEPFFTTKELGKGTGLGLSTVYGVVQQSGGSIWVYSEVGKGTAVKVYLPRVEAVAHPDQPAPTVTSLQGTETILIVEDEEAVRGLTQRILQAAGYTVLTAGNGGEALLVLERHDGSVHLTLTDMVMPGMSGRDLATQLEAISPRTKVLFTSGYTDEALLHNGLLGKATHFVGKPYTAAELTRKVREVLDS